MNTMDLLTVLLSLGVGGVVGAIAAAALAMLRVKSAFETFSRVFREYISGKNDKASLEIRGYFESLSEEILTATNAMERLRRALKRK